MNPNFPDQEHLKCPRCDSANTKFCYYNNYNLSQPRHFCKNCRRYWTKGGTLRNIPVGGGTRKHTKRSSNATKRPAPTSPAAAPPPPPTPLPPPLPPKPEPSGIFGFGGNQLEVGGGSFSALLGSNHMGPFGNLLMDGKSDDDVLIRNPIGDEFRSNFLRINNSNNESGNGGGESSSWNEGENGWPDLSIFTPGSSFR